MDEVMQKTQWGGGEVGLKRKGMKQHSLYLGHNDWANARMAVGKWAKQSEKGENDWKRAQPNQQWPKCPNIGRKEAGGEILWTGKSWQ